MDLEAIAHGGNYAPPPLFKPPGNENKAPEVLTTDQIKAMDFRSINQNWEQVAAALEKGSP